MATPFKPNKSTSQIHYSGDANYEPDFVAETEDSFCLCEPKAEVDVKDETVLAIARSASEWCQHASTVSSKPWKYLLIPHTTTDESKTLAGLVAQYEFKNQEEDA